MRREYVYNIIPLVFSQNVNLLTMSCEVLFWNSNDKRTLPRLHVLNDVESKIKNNVHEFARRQLQLCFFQNA